MIPVDSYLETNRSLWNHWTRIHEKSAFYDVDSFRAGRSTLNSVEIEELGSVEGKSLLHLQCHFGMDTLSWARMGADVVGVDFSDAAIALAHSLSDETGVDARFIRANIYDLPDVLPGTFDVVFTSYGVINWLPDIQRWGKIVARYLKPGGTFYVVEFHPFANVLADDGTRVSRSYFHTREPEQFQENGSYADPEADFSHPAYFWNHGLGDIITALAAAGLRIEFVHEFPYSAYNCFAFVEERGPGKWWPRVPEAQVPLMFSIRATR